MAFLIIPHVLSIPRWLGRPRRLTRGAAPSVGRDIPPMATTALCRARSPVATLSMVAPHSADPVVHRPCVVRGEDAAAFRHRCGEGRLCPPPQPYSRAQHP